MSLQPTVAYSVKSSRSNSSQGIKCSHDEDIKEDNKGTSTSTSGSHSRRNYRNNSRFGTPKQNHVSTSGSELSASRRLLAALCVNRGTNRNKFLFSKHAQEKNTRYFS